jgi:tRNA(Ile2) C34 agmatinyltransferase TiaS
MEKYTEEELKQVFENRSNCYADSDEVIMAMDKDRFIEVLKELKILPIQRVMNQVCPKCKSDHTVSIMNGEYSCFYCGNKFKGQTYL